MFTAETTSTTLSRTLGYNFLFSSSSSDAHQFSYTAVMYSFYPSANGIFLAQLRAWIKWCSSVQLVGLYVPLETQQVISETRIKWFNRHFTKIVSANVIHQRNAQKATLDYALLMNDTHMSKRQYKMAPCEHWKQRHHVASDSRYVPRH